MSLCVLFVFVIVCGLDFHFLRIVSVYVTFAPSVSRAESRPGSAKQRFEKCAFVRDVGISCFHFKENSGKFFNSLKNASNGSKKSVDGHIALD